MFGARNTIGISLLATLLAYLMGITLGILAAVKGGWIDMGISRVNDAILALPTIMLGLIVIAALGSSIPILIGTAAVIYATSVFRIARALGQDIMVQDFVEAAKTRGEGVWWIIRAEVLPNAAHAPGHGLRVAAGVRGAVYFQPELSWDWVCSRRRPTGAAWCGRTFRA